MVLTIKRLQKNGSLSGICITSWITYWKCQPIGLNSANRTREINHDKVNLQRNSVSKYIHSLYWKKGRDYLRTFWKLSCRLDLSAVCSERRKLSEKPLWRASQWLCLLLRNTISTKYNSNSKLSINIIKLDVLFPSKYNDCFFSQYCYLSCLYTRKIVLAFLRTYITRYQLVVCVFHFFSSKTPIRLSETVHGFSASQMQLVNQ